ncbi:MAG: type IV pili methyl-accepting chemotaxis transducer N-terminal domain-containing protein [Pseudomonadota bacterium]
MLSKIKTATFVLSCVVALQPGVTLAEETNVVRAPLVAEDNAEQRINLSGKLRMLSQRIPSAACHLSRGIDVETAGQVLLSALNEFDAILSALEFGDPELNIINPETHKRTLARIQELRVAWEPLKQASQAIAAGKGTDADLRLVFSQNIEVLSAAVNLVPALVKQYSNPNAVPYDKLMLIDISGRQRMLTQKVSKEACMMGTPYKTANTPTDLEATVQIFEASLNALRHGMPELGLLPPPNDSIEAGLEDVLVNWNGVKPLLDAVLQGDTLGLDALEQNFEGLNATMSNMNKVVGLYADTARRSS